MQLNRRQFISLAGLGLTIGLAPASAADAKANAGVDLERTQDVPETPAFAQPFLRVGIGGRVTVIAKHLEMGQGIWSGLALIVAEELDASWDQIDVEGAPVNAAVYKNLIFGWQTTGGSTSTANSWDQLRHAGALARSMLVQAAAARLGTAPDRLTVADGVVHGPSGQALSFGDLAIDASRLALPERVALKDPASFKLIGHAQHRLDSRAKSDGSAIFAGDIRRPGLKVAMLVRPARFGASLRSFDDREAMKIEGVRQIVGVPLANPNAVAVIADDTWSALRAKRALVVTWDESTAERRSSAELIGDFRKLASGGLSIDCVKRGDTGFGFAHATRIVEAEYELPYLAHQAMEPIVSTGEWRDGRCDIWAGTQNVGADHDAVRKILGLDGAHVHLHTTFVGGSFGRRATFNSDWISELAHVLVATEGRWPIRLQWTREDDIRGGYYRPMSYQRIRAALATDGRMIAVEQTIVAQSFLFTPPAPGKAPAIADPLVFEGSIATRYAIPEANVKWFYPHAAVPVQMYRALSHNHTTFTKEAFIDEVAVGAGWDPVAYRLAHLDSGNANQARQANVLRNVAARAGWGRALPVDTAIGIAVQESQGSFVAHAAEVTLRNGVAKIERVTCAIDCGLAVNPAGIMAQMESGAVFGISAALHSEIRLENGATVQSNFHDQPVLRMPEMPARVDIDIVDSPHPPTGVGEPCSVPIVAAVAIAIAKLTGKPARRLPSTI